MFKPVSLFVGLRYTRARRSNKFISITAFISTIGFMVGVAVLITVLSVMNGFDRELKNRILGMIPQATVSSNQIIPDWQLLVAKAKQQPHVIGAAPFTQVQGMLTAQGQVAGVVISGIEPDLEKNVSIVQNHMTEGSLDALTDGSFGIVIGKTMADNLGLMKGDKVTLVLPEATASPAGVVPRFKRFTIVGIFSVGAEMDSSLGYIALNDAAKLLRLPDGAQGVRLKLDDLFSAREISNDFARELPSGFYASDWTQTQGNLFSAIQMERTMLGLILSLIILVAALNIFSSLVMVVNDKKADIAILRTLGASPKTITRIFVVQGLVIGAVGTFSGTLLGIGIALGISPFLTWLNNFFGLHLLDAYFVNYLPSELRWTNVALIVGISLVLSFIATIYPALRAARIQPAEALRYE
ncbi:lipoprotein-releasing ABC transporter permease subunit [Aquirhabdus parva]|uniref:Lipoprotein-releasing ABC transporter permease subunit n=1 Tax=Aquirhabdus parva TaxID=2283318 RepID=A0A345P3K6_9GAMM|nr:lipoprotein-releasing ABC transporter permease subunit [Aquirhabdus parva]AXI01865.1 lipoprotein-releasing ABC transporter permease subunit [Aquirhabdus parva]